jgi:hypothetical protein
MPHASFSRPASFASGEPNSIFVTLDRSVRAASGCSAIALAWCGQTWSEVARSADASASAAPGSNTSCSTSVAPAASVAPIAIAMPAVQKNGYAV